MIKMTKTLFAVALLGPVIAQPAYARTNSDAAATTAKVPNAAPARTASEASKKYCFAVEATGSRFVKNECRTKAEWLRVGVELDAKK